MSFGEDAIRGLDEVVVCDFVSQFAQFPPLFRRRDDSALSRSGQAIENRALVREFDLVQRSEQALDQKVAKARES